MKLTASIFAFVRELGDFSYELSSLDRVWNILFPDKGEKWHHLHVNKYKHTFYITHVDGDGGSLEVERKKGVRTMNSMGAPSHSVSFRLISRCTGLTSISPRMKTSSTSCTTMVWAGSSAG